MVVYCAICCAIASLGELLAGAIAAGTAKLALTDDGEVLPGVVCAPGDAVNDEALVLCSEVIVEALDTAETDIANSYALKRGRASYSGPAP
jgi:hypothetical protein